MKRLIITRHGESIANANNIIQGITNNYGLSKKGKENTIIESNKYYVLLKNCERIVCSTFQRTKETAKLISDVIKLPIVENENIIEINSGILSGMNKEYAQKNYFEYYRVWKNRLDLDPIPEAEKGDNLQARVICFLMNYYDKKEYNDIIVSHAGFIRCLINTIESRERTTQFDIKNNCFFEVNNIFDKLEIYPKKRAMSSKVYIVTSNKKKYVVKIKKGNITERDYAENDILNTINSQKVPNILYMQNYNNNEFCKVLKYINGKHIYGKLNKKQINSLIESDEKLATILCNIKDNRFKVINLKDKIQKIYNNTREEFVREVALELLNSKYCTAIEDESEYVLSHNDLNRDNILFEENDKGKVVANIIDYESLEFSPKDYQFASTLACGILLEGHELSVVENIIKEKNKEIYKILYLMQIRLLNGLYFFSQKNNIYINNNKKLSVELYNKYYCACKKLKGIIK